MLSTKAAHNQAHEYPPLIYRKIDVLEKIEQELLAEPLARKEAASQANGQAKFYLFIDRVLQPLLDEDGDGNITQSELAQIHVSANLHIHVYKHVLYVAD